MEIGNIIKIIEEERQRYHIHGRTDAQAFCDGLGVDINGLVYLLVTLILTEQSRHARMRDRISELERENEFLDECFDSVCKGNGRLKQLVKVEAGMPIAKKSKKSLSDLRLRLKLGATDKELLEVYGISRTTLWRWKKELEKQGKSNKIRV